MLATTQTTSNHTAHAWVCAQFAAIKDACCEYMRNFLDEASAASTLTL